MAKTRPPTLIVNPADDADFRRDAEAALQDGASAADLQENLRRDHPRAIVRVREIAGEVRVVWYVYREGHWVSRHDRGQE